MTKGFDCSVKLSYDQALALANTKVDNEFLSFAVRYLVPDKYTKYLSKGEADAIKATTLKLVSIYESYAERALTGYDGGYADGLIAAKCAADVGQPEGSTIYTAVDFDVSTNDMQTVIDYVKGFSAATPNHTTGVYGSYAVVKACHEANACSHFWQTYAWSRGQKYEYNNLYQYKNGVSLCGVSLDLNESYDNVGWWGLDDVNVTTTTTTAPEPPKQTYPLSVEQANYIIERWVSHEYELADSDDQFNRHNLANALRIASGQSLE